MRLIGKRYDVFSFLGLRLEHQFCGTLKLLFDSRVKPFIQRAARYLQPNPGPHSAPLLTENASASGGSCRPGSQRLERRREDRGRKRL
jgi:hypothetical protein